MILGVGVDLCSVERIRHSLGRFGDPWINQIFTTDERQMCAAYSDPALLFAQAFCVKEACAKALGTGMTNEIDWQNIEILGTGGASLRLSGSAQMRLEEITPFNCRAELKISCSSDRLYAQAIVLAIAIRLGCNHLEQE